MNGNKLINSGSITAWLRKRSKQNINDLTLIAVSSEAQIHLNKYTFSTFLKKNEQSLNEPTIFPSLTTTIKLNCDTEKVVFFAKKRKKVEM